MSCKPCIVGSVMEKKDEGYVQFHGGNMVSVVGITQEASSVVGGSRWGWGFHWQ